MIITLTVSIGVSVIEDTLEQDVKTVSFYN